MMEEPRPISIWLPREVDGERVFERPDPGPLGDHYAIRKTIPVKKQARRRICFFGESAAAGYLYAPHLTPAQVLEDQLTHLAGPGEFEMIDLARTNETLGPLVATVEAAMQLAPDLLVIYTGNNWTLLETPELSPYAPSVRARQRYAEALAECGILGPARQARMEIAELAGRAFAQIGAFGVPVLLVIPEVNLADWESLQPVVWLPGDRTARWYAAYERALALLAEDRPDAAEAAAWEMVELDGGTNPTPFRLLARALLAQGRTEEARDACISEVDSQHYALLGFLGAPQATTVAREILEHAARRHGFATVDLRPVFAEHGGSPLPGRRFFLDYCHLTVEGMQVAMAGVAAEVLRATGVREESWRDLLARLPAPVLSPEADAVAKLGAALHNAHRLLPVVPEAKLPLLEHWCQAALDASSVPADIAEALFDVAAARATPGPAVLSAAFARNFASPYRLLLQHGWRWDFLDADLLQAIQNVLTRAGHPGGEEIDRLLLAGYGLPAEGADLSRLPFLAEPLARFFPEAMTTPGLAGRAAYRAPWPESSFCLICDATQDVDLTLTARLPLPPGMAGAEPRRGEVTLTVNARPAGKIDLAERWSRHTLRIGRDSLRSGLNRITLRWPPSPPWGEEALAAARRRLEAGIEADLHPVFGEVFSLLAGMGRPP
ncbi:MAG: hypothetical protein QOJ16_5098 [Acidobacteriota bacterium]|jgi:hypothetical protein|nr:hypothetical protein [Acidobacteriota bacterium]